jgi:hypothetical protein
MVAKDMLNGNNSNNLGWFFLIKDIQLDKFVEKHQNKAHFIIGSKNYYSTLTNFAP